MPQKGTSTLRMRVCRQCGIEFMGGPRAWYCPYNNGGSVEWYERSEDQENDYEEFDVEVEYSYTDED